MPSYVGHPSNLDPEYAPHNLQQLLYEVRPNPITIDPPIMHQSLITVEYRGPKQTRKGVKGARIILRWGGERVSIALESRDMKKAATEYLAGRDVTVISNFFLPENFVERHCKDSSNIIALIVEFQSGSSLS